jgi:hypothetical protein
MQQEHLTIIRLRLKSLFASFQNLTQNDLLELKWNLRIQIFAELLGNHSIGQEATEDYEALIEQRHNQYSIWKKNPDQVSKEKKQEFEIEFRTNFMSIVLKILERIKWPTAMIPFSDPMHDLLHTKEIIYDAISFMLQILYPSKIQEKSSQQRTQEQNQQQTENDEEQENEIEEDHRNQDQEESIHRTNRLKHLQVPNTATSTVAMNATPNNNNNMSNSSSHKKENLVKSQQLSSSRNYNKSASSSHQQQQKQHTVSDPLIDDNNHNTLDTNDHTNNNHAGNDENNPLLSFTHHHTNHPINRNYTMVN